MFFKRLKALSLQKNITLVLKSRAKDFHRAKVTSVGIIFDYDSYCDYAFFQDLMNGLGIMDNKIRFIAMINQEKKLQKMVIIFPEHP